MTIQGTELHWSTCNTEFVLRYTSVGGHAPAVAEQKLTEMGRSSWLVLDCTRAILWPRLQAHSKLGKCRLHVCMVGQGCMH